MGRHSAHRAAHPHLPVDVPTSPSAGKTGRVGSANHNGNIGRRSGAPPPNPAPTTQAIPCPPRRTTSTSTMATTTAACHLDNPPPGQCASHRPPTTDDQRRAVSNHRPASQPETVNGECSRDRGYHRGAAPRQDRPLGPSQSRVPKT